MGALNDLLRPWRGTALRHIPVGTPFDVLDFRFAGKSAENRWNEAGAPTLFLAGDEGVLIAEWGRHFRADRDLSLQQETVERAIFRLELAVERMLDLRGLEVSVSLSLSGAPGCFVQRAVARASAQFVRATTAAQGLIVPSVAFLDQPDRWCLVLFLDKLPEPAQFVSSVRSSGVLRLTPGAGE